MDPQRRRELRGNDQDPAVVAARVVARELQDATNRRFGPFLAGLPARSWNRGGRVVPVARARARARAPSRRASCTPSQRAPSSRPRPTC
jgi:hypothetical protein